MDRRVQYRLLRFIPSRRAQADLLACQRKRHYPTWWDAEREALRAIEAQHDGRIKRQASRGHCLAYQCRVCGLWCWGHSWPPVLIRDKMAPRTRIPCPDEEAPGGHHPSSSPDL